ncbi:unnamed protein product [Caenorhabditis angaria]|uniref:SH2 domain-containing protein n=1 Tax=Caenorhabditis angaria TaxID=860376 RepID=A0A9P1IHM9_9PELO|nr:unnamed protein product [Caenorhabditis angaria]
MSSRSVSGKVEDLENAVFIGAVTKQKAEQRIGNRSFVIYYRLPDDGTIPYSMELFLVYYSSNGKFYHFSISQRKQIDGMGKICKDLFKVECGDSLDFLSLESLIRHYETFVYHDISTGAMETFPVGSKEGSIYDVYK